MNGYKYIVYIGPADMPTPVIFPPWVQHKAIADGLKVQPRSAGFIKIEKSGRLVCRGESDSLNLKPHDEDAEVLNL